MSHIDEIEYLTMTASDTQITLAEAIVRSLLVLHGDPRDLNIYIPVQTEDSAVLIALGRTTNVWSGEPWDPEDLWLSDLIAQATDGKVVRSWAYSLNVPQLHMQHAIGYGADGLFLDTSLMFGRPVETEMPTPVSTYFLAQSRVLWGSAWSPLP